MLVLHAHPDDEVFATGAATFALADHGAVVSLRVFTGGEAAARQLEETALQTARAARIDALAKACTLVGIAEWGFVTRPGEWLDSRLSGAITLAQASGQDLALAARKAVDEVQPDLVLTMGREGLTNHPDHIQVHRAVTSALALPGWRPSRALGASLRASDVDSARRALTDAYSDGAASFAAIKGAATPTIGIGAGKDFELRRRQALDIYAPGLGSTAARDLPTQFPRPSGSVFVRRLFDLSGWTTDRFMPIAIP